MNVNVKDMNQYPQVVVLQRISTIENKTAIFIVV